MRFYVGPAGFIIVREMVQTFTALRYRNYRLWFFGQLVSLFGTWMQSTAQGYLVYELTQSPAYLGYVAFFTGIPTWVLMLYGGVIADRMSKRKLLLITQIAMMMLALILALIIFMGIVRPWHLLVLAFLLGIATSFDAPARQAFVLELVERDDLTNAIALNSTMFNLATILGPAAGGIIYAASGPGWCFFFNGLSFLAIIVGLTLMRLDPPRRALTATSTVSEVKEGLQYAMTEPKIRILIILLALTSLFGMSFVTLIPAWAVKILRGDATTAGFLQSARGAGALVSGLFLASLGRAQIREKLLVAGTYLFPVTLSIFAATRSLAFALMALFLSGAALMLILNLVNALLQSMTADHLRGRIMSIHGLTFFGLMPLGGLLAGFSAEHIGETWTLYLFSLIILLSAITFSSVNRRAAA